MDKWERAFISNTPTAENQVLLSIKEKIQEAVWNVFNDNERMVLLDNDWPMAEISAYDIDVLNKNNDPQNPDFSCLVLLRSNGVGILPNVDVGKIPRKIRKMIEKYGFAASVGWYCIDGDRIINDPYIEIYIWQIPQSIVKQYHIASQS